jgi:predicted AlkP superfamily pyrophosphatase or phosphodiesterase
LRTGGKKISVWVAGALLAVGVVVPAPEAAGNHEPGHPVQDQGLTDPGEEQVFSDALPQLLDNPNVDTVITMRDGSDPREGCSLSGRVYWAYSERGTICFAAHPVGAGWDFDVQLLAGENPFKKTSHTALATLEEELAASGEFVGDPPNRRNLVSASNVTYPFVYERIVAEFDSPRTGDFVIMPDNTADVGGPGAHGHAGVTQSRSTLLISGRGARRSPLSSAEEAALRIQHPDIAPTVASALGINAYFEDTGQPAKRQNGTDSQTALLKRQDGHVLKGLLEPKFNNFVVVVDGLRPQDVTPSLMPNLTSLVDADCATPGDGCATTYEAARGIMVSETNANHVAMMTGAYGEGSGIVANDSFDRNAGDTIETDEPQLNLAETLFDQIETQKPWLTTAAVMGKEKLRDLFDCTRDESDGCGPSSANPEGTEVDHERPDFLGGALGPDPDFDPSYDCPAEPGTGSGYTTNACVMDVTLRVLGEQDPDFTFVNLPEVDGFSHLSGPGNPAAQEAVADADEQVGRLIDRLKETGRWQHSTLTVTADHNFGVTESPEDRIFLDELLDGAGPEPFAAVPHGGSASVYLTDLDNPNGPLTESEQSTLKSLRDLALAEPAVEEALYRLDNAVDGGTQHTLDAVHPDWQLGGSPRTGELLLTAAETHFFVESFTDDDNAPVGNHGHPVDRHIPFIVASGGKYVADGSVAPSDPAAVDEADDTAALPEQAENVDIAPTISWLLGVDPPAQNQGRILKEAFVKHPMKAQRDGDITEPIANRAALFMFDANNSVELHCLIDETTCGPEPPAGASEPDTVANLRSLANAGTFTNYGSIAAWPSVTFPNHNTVGNGAYPGHHGIVNNRFYIRETGEIEEPINPQSLEHPLFTFSSALLTEDVETLHEAVHRTYGNWEPADGPLSDKAFTASVDEPSSRGADYATLEPDQSFPNPAPYIATENPAELASDSSQSCVEDNPDGYGQESFIDHIGQTQARRLFDDEAEHPLPKYLINNFSLTDGAGHHFGPHTECAIAAYRDGDARLGRVIDAMKSAGTFGETLIVVTGDHGMENQDLDRAGLPSQFSSYLEDRGVKHVMADWHVYLKTMDVESSTAQFNQGQESTSTFTVTDDDTAAPIEGAEVTVGNATGETSGTTDADGKVELTFTPTGGPVTVTVTHADYNERTRAFPIRCPGLEDLPGNHIAGTSGDDVLTGTPGPDVICGLGGNDVLGGASGEDRIYGGPGDDEIRGSLDADRLKGGGGSDSIWGGGSADAIRGEGADDVVRAGSGEDDAVGGRGDDVVYGGAESDLLYGRDGDDDLFGQDFPDELFGGAGNDLLDGGRLSDRCVGGSGINSFANCERN